MSHVPSTFCLDANVLIQAWKYYYSPEFCPQYWEILIELGQSGRIFLPEDVYNEVAGEKGDDLSDWLQKSGIPVYSKSTTVLKCWKDILAADPAHKYLVDNTKNRSLADPWVVATAMANDAVVVTKEIKVTQPSSKNIKIPNVCHNMGIPCINDSTFIKRLDIRFHCKLPPHL